MMIHKELSLLQNIQELDYNTEKTVFELFEQNAKDKPDKIALVFGDQTMSYKELNQKSNQLARMLRDNFVKPNDIVGILANRSMEMFIGILAIIKAGGAYLPIDPEYPIERIHYMLDDCNINVLLTMEHLKDFISFQGKTLYLDRNQLYQGDSNNLENLTALHSLIYVIYTSGSTGLPKGTLIEHKSIINLISGLSSIIDFKEDKTILSLASFAFDMSIPEILLPLAKGMKIVIATEEQKNNPKYLNDCIIKNQVTMMQITPSRLQLMFNYGKSIDFLTVLTEIMVGAEPFPKALLEKLKEHTRAKIYNLYGPTETTVWSTVGDLTSSNIVTVGAPIQNTQILILNHQGELCPIGEEGELCISGDGLARGYLNRPELTNEKFIVNKYLKGEKLYRTGDLARMLPNGILEVLGRMDGQVKLNGKRIELGEIEYHLLKYNKIKEAVVVVKDNILCAFIVSDSTSFDSDVNEYLEKFLPHYMIPTNYIKIDKVPLSFNGKVDKKALLQLEIASESELMSYNPSQSGSLVTQESRLRKVVSEIVPNRTKAFHIMLNEPLTTIGIDSVAFVKLIVSTEMEFHIEFEDQYLDFKKLPTLSSILSLVDKYLEQ